MTTPPLPHLPRRNRTLAPRATPAPHRTPSGAWAAPTPEVLRALEAALARWSS